jgi:membrane protein CcdC involved in cytochrome C biogenesis
MEISGVASVPKTSAGLFFLFVFSVIITGTVILYLRYRRPRVGTT